MKILNIKFKNLNSLKGEWHINLSEKVYDTNGIFVITGPTGAGKTTIFDAVCLALYGKTPRLENISNSQNEIMSRRTRDCYSSVEFEAYGKKYLAHWSQVKLKSNKLQDITHTLSDPETGDIIAERKNGETIKKIKEITGLDFNRFKQAVMLEQGGFDAFLKAKASERSQILELLTGTEIYGKISTMVYERNALEKQKLEKINERKELLKPDDGFSSEEEIKTELEKNKSEITKLENDFNKTRTDLEIQKNISKYEYELVKNQDEINQLIKETEIFTKDKRRLDKALKANEIMGEYLKLLEKRKNVLSSQSRHDKYEKSISYDSHKLSEIENDKLPDLEYNLNKRLNGIKSPEGVYAKAKELMLRIEQLGRKIIELKEENEKITSETKKISLRLNEARKNYISANEEYETALKNLYENELRKLKDGQPCPVCGSKIHPYAEKLKTKTSGKFISLDEAKKKFDNASKVLHELESKYAAILEKSGSSQKALHENENLKLEAKTKVLEIIEPLGIFGKTCSEINSKIDTWLKEVKYFDNEIQKLKKIFDTLKAQIETNKKSLLDENSNLGILKAELENLESDFKTKLKEKNFENEDDFKASILEQKELEKLQRREKELGDNFNKLKAVKENITKLLENERKKSNSTLKLEELQQKFKDEEQNLNKLQKIKFGLEKALEDRMKLKTELEQINKEYKKQEKISIEWKRLDDLIGQKDGGKFRVFVQKITLNTLASLANVQLEKMTGRYNLIVRPDDKDKELNLSVIDKDQADEIRPTENLSGGERFIVSLALALSLSQISGNKIKVDSLFLDEGFGSLDEESLNTALDALGEVKREGKLIGIISHVQALKERISTQINVIPKREGVSILEGAGVSSPY